MTGRVAALAVALGLHGSAQAADPGRVALGAGYFGDLVTHPGASVDGDLYLVDGEWGSFSLPAQLAGYVHPRNHGALLFSVQAAPRLHTGKGWTLGLQAGVGVHYAFLPGDVYEEQEDGSMAVVADAGRAHFMPIGGLDLGWEGWRRDLAPVRPFLRVTAFAEVPVNQSALAHVAVEAGVMVRPLRRP